MSSRWQINDSAVAQLRLIGDDDYDGNTRVRNFLEQIGDYTPTWLTISGEKVAVFDLASFRVMAIQLGGDDIVVYIREVGADEEAYIS